jgi:23S rRNA (uracil1939-C5)-methyltransferase
MIDAPGGKLETMDVSFVNGAALEKAGVLVGFHEKRSSFIADMRECHVLPPAASALLVPLRELVGALSIRDRMPQVEMAHVETHIELVLRVLQSPTDEDRLLLRQFSERHAVALWLQSSGPDSIEYLCGPAGSRSTLHYALPEFGVVMPFRPTDFTQVNHAINATLVGRALRLLDAQANERVADLFCGLGNFTLPLATMAAEVVGIEGSKALVERALRVD